VTLDRAAGRRLFGWALVVMVALLESGAGAPSLVAPAEILATWRGGTLLRADHESWRAFHRVEAGPEAIREQVFVESLAAVSRQRGAEREPRTRLELEAMRQRVLVSALRRQVVGSVVVGDEEIEEALREQPHAFQRPRKLRLRSIYLRLDPDPIAAAATRRRIAGIHRRLVEGASFEDVARRESQSQSRFSDGDLGFLAMEDLPPEVASAIRDLQPGQLSEPIEHGEGVSIFRCEDVQPAAHPGPDEVRRKARTVLEQYHRRKAWAGLQEELLRAAAPALQPESATAPLVMKGYRMSAEEFALLLSLRSPAGTSFKPGAESQAGMLRAWALGVLGVRRAVELGLDRGPETAAALRWGRVDVLAHEELVRRIDERLGEPDEADLRALFDARPLRYAGQDSLEVAAIYFGSDHGPDRRERVQLAQRVARRLDRGEIGFEEAARRYSVDSSAASGGLIGWRTRPQIASWGATATRVFRQLEPGERSGLLRTESGLWIFELRGIRPAGPPSFETAGERLRADWRQRRIHELEGAVREEQLAGLGLTIREATSPNAPGS
jgi:parvulin-like peptidyl-prolyl isomerase